MPARTSLPALAWNQHLIAYNLAAFGGVDWAAAVPGVAVALFAFGLATARDAFNAARNRKRRDRAVVAAITEEMNANREIAVNNRELIATELAVLDEQDRIVNPLDPLESGFWELVKLNPPRVIEDDEDALARARRVARLTGQVNEMTRSREAFRALGPSLPVYGAGDDEPPWVPMLRGYDSLLERFLGELIEAIDELGEHLAE